MRKKLDNIKHDLKEKSDTQRKNRVYWLTTCYELNGYFNKYFRAYLLEDSLGTGSQPGRNS